MALAWWLALGYPSTALACFVTIISIPFGIQHIKLALIALAPGRHEGGEVKTLI